MSALTFAALRRLADGRFHSGEAIARSLGRSRATLSEALKRAPELGVEVFSVRGKGYKLAQPLEFLDAAALAAALAGTRIRVEVVDEIDSTSTRVLQAAMGGAPAGTCLVAEWQSAGRGRRGRTWVASLGGSLTFSLLWRFDRGAGHLGGLSLAVGLAIAQGLERCGVPRVQVKWPNDVVIDLRKIAGILIETSGEIQGPAVAVIGVGVNYRLPEATVDRIDQPVIDVAAGTATPPTRTALLAALLRELDATLGTFEHDGFAPLRDAWRARHAYAGKRVRVMPGQDAAYEATVTDVGTDGALHVATDDGRLHALASAEISLRPRG